MENRKYAPAHAMPPSTRVRRAIRSSVTTYGTEINCPHRYSARAAAKRRERLRKNPALRESASERAWCATIGPANTQRGRPPQSRIPRQRVILMRLRIGGRQDLAAFAAMAGETTLA